MGEVDIETLKEEIKDFISLYRKLNEAQKAGFQLMLEGAVLLSTQKKNGTNKCTVKSTLSPHPEHL